MRKKLLKSFALVPAVLVFTMSIAIAVDQTNGSGLTHEGASLGFNAKANLHGNITYTSHDGTMFQVFCHDGLTSYRNLKPTAAGALRTKVTATCKDKTGTTIYAEIYFIDRGEPGNRDVERIYFTYNAAFELDANADPDVYLMTCNSSVEVTVACNDAGIITTGNVQIHQGSPSQAKQMTLVIGDAA